MSEIDESHRDNLAAPNETPAGTTSSTDAVLQARKAGVISSILSIFPKRQFNSKESQNETQRNKADNFRRIDSFCIADIETDIDRIFSIYGPFDVAYGGFTEKGNPFIVCYQENKFSTKMKHIALIDYHYGHSTDIQECHRSKDSGDDNKLEVAEGSRSGAQILEKEQDELWTDIDFSEPTERTMEEDWTLLDRTKRRA